MILALLLATVQVDPYQDEVYSEPPPAVAQTMQQQAPAQAEPSKREIKQMAKRLKELGELYKVMGHCTGLMSPGDVEGIMRQAYSDPRAAGYLMGKYEEGFLRPKNDKWCLKELGPGAQETPETQDY